MRRSSQGNRLTRGTGPLLALATAIVASCTTGCAGIDVRVATTQSRSFASDLLTSTSNATDTAPVEKFLRQHGDSPFTCAEIVIDRGRPKWSPSPRLGIAVNDLLDGGPGGGVAGDGAGR